MTNVYPVSSDEMVEQFKNHFMMKNEKNVDLSMIVYECNDVYIGEQVKDIKEGYGTLYYANGNVYSGNWRNNKKEGCGVLLEKTGTRYVGKWKNDMFHWHKNQIQYGSGHFYEGRVDNGDLTGEGTMIYKNSEIAIYKGDWLDGYWHGKGVVKYTDGETYDGEFYKNERTGQGKCVWASGIEYEGEWKKDRIDGEGTLDARKLDNRVHFGPWKQGVQQQSGHTMTMV